MPPTPIRIPTLIGGVSRLAQSQRLIDEVEVADNVSIDLPDGISKRAASLLVGTTNLVADTPTQTKHIGWIDRDETERFVFMIDPVGSITTIVCTTDITTAPRPGDRITQLNSGAVGIVVNTDLTTETLRVITVGATVFTTNGADTLTDDGGNMAPTILTVSTVVSGTKDIDEIVEIFDISDGTAVTLTQPPDEVLAYIAFNAWVTGYDPRRRLRTLSIADSTLVLARNVLTSLRGGDITYQNGSGGLVRLRADSHNVTTWSDLDQPPTSFTTPIPNLDGDFGGTTTFNDAAIWFTQEDDIGQPRSWWWATSGTFPPWYQQIRTEPAFSVINERTFPMRMDFDGTLFTMSTVDWIDRRSGDGATNPGPSFVGSGISDMSYHQDRLFLASGEILASSQAGDLFNLWVQSEQLGIDSDPIDTPTSNNRISNIDFMIPFREALLLTTSGGKQFELRADGPLSPNTAFLNETTAVKSVNYVEPATLADQVYFAGERNFANTLYEYFFDPGQSSNKANDVTRPVRGYIPAQMSQMAAAPAHDTVFILTDAEDNNIYVYKPVFDDKNNKIMSAWYRWSFQSTDEILSIQVFDEDLYMVIRRNSLIWLERVAVEQPEVDTIGAAPTLESMGYQVRLDSRLSLQGVYNVTTDITRWTLPFVDNDTDYEIVLGPGWDVDVGSNEQRLAGTRFINLTITDDGSNTFLDVPGQFEDNLNGDPETAYVGKQYNMTVELSEQFVRDENGVPVQGTVGLLSCIVRHKNTGFYSVRTTPEGRDSVEKEFIFQRTGSTALDGVFIEDDGQFEPRTIGKAHSTRVEILNDSPLPCTIVDLEFKTNFRASKKDPTR